MKRAILSPAIVAVAGAIIALCHPQEKPAPEPPKITIEQQANYLQARAEFAEARIAYDQAERKYQEIVKQLQAVCPLELKNGRPECTKETTK
jgi:hypothetical protein